LDAAPFDAAPLDAAPFDAAPVDAAALDATVTDDDAGDAMPIFGDDAGPCFFDGGGYDYCACDPPTGADCSVAPCAGGLVCLRDGCGMHCAPPGRPCGGAGDCPAGSTCSAIDGSMFCTRAAGCVDSRDCPAGFACETGSCRDRRIRCDVDEACPFGFVCSAFDVGTPYCVRTSTRCATDAGCIFAMFCRDLDGDGPRECIAPGVCDANADCPARSTCETMPTEMFAVCGAHGACRTSADCAVGASCADLWGDGLRECVEAGATCARTADCPGTQVCASPATGGPASCSGRSL
ncbi:MAG: hypothetical protein M3Y87_15660, partial [Myxococcota bacterium]|nr:hypothetical protein [Myxococcota bacterium]